MREHAAQGFRLGIDIGGTFTDVVLLGGRRRGPHDARCSRRPTTTRAASSTGAEALLDEHGVAAGRDRPVSCTPRPSRRTRSSRARRADGARSPPTASATCSRCGASGSPSCTTCSTSKPTPLVPRRLRFEVAERIGPRGEVWARARRGVGARRGRRGGRASGVEAVAIALLHSYANPTHERRVAEIVRGRRSATASTSPAPPTSCPRSASTSARARPSSTPTSARRSRATSARSSTRLQEAGIDGAARGHAVGRRHDERRRRAQQQPAYLVESGPAAGVIACALPRPR